MQSKNYWTGIPFIDNYRITTFVVGSPEMRAESSISTELGYRYMQQNWNFDLSLFHTNSDNAITIQPNIDISAIQQASFAYMQGNAQMAQQLMDSTQFNLVMSSGGEKTSKGGELSVGWQALPELKLELGYSLFSYDLNTDGDSLNLFNQRVSHQNTFKAIYNPNTQYSIYTLLRHEDGEVYQTDDFTTLDINGSYQLNRKVSLTLNATGLLEGRHAQFSVLSDSFTAQTYQERSVTLGLKVELE